MLPNDDDVRGAATGLSRLQQLYRLDITDLIQGYIKGQKYSSEMSTYNCFVMGVSLYESKEYLPASEWLIEALYKAENIDKMYENHISKEVDLPEDDPDKVDSLTYGIFPYPNIERILEYLGPALYEAGKQELAQIINTRLLQLEPDNQYGLTNKLLFESKVKTDRRKRIVTPAAEISKMKDLYEQVCNGYLQKTPQEKRHLHCHYSHKNLPYYFLGPLKMELLNQDPFVAQYYDVIYENEIRQILQAVEDSIERSSIGSNNDSYIDEVRISKNSWLDYDAIFMQRISQRLQYITGLSMDNSEEMQVANYGIGGYYGTHYDFAEVFVKMKLLCI